MEKIARLVRRKYDGQVLFNLLSNAFKFTPTEKSSDRCDQRPHYRKGNSKGGRQRAGHVKGRGRRGHSNPFSGQKPQIQRALVWACHFQRNWYRCIPEILPCGANRVKAPVSKLRFRSARHLREDQMTSEKQHSLYDELLFFKKIYLKQRIPASCFHRCRAYPADR